MQAEYVKSKQSLWYPIKMLLFASMICFQLSLRANFVPLPNEQNYKSQEFSYSTENFHMMLQLACIELLAAGTLKSLL